MAVSIAMFEKGDTIQVATGYGDNRQERELKVESRDIDPDRGDMLHEPVLFLKCVTVSRFTACRLEKLVDGRVRFRYEGSDSPQEVHAAWGRADPDWDTVPERQ